MRRLWAILVQRCPVCLQGPVFCSLLEMHKECPVCGVRYEREHGYFLNSMFVGYALGFLLLAPSAVWLALRQVSVASFAIVITLEAVVLCPIVFRYARVIWMHADQVLDPRLSDAPVALTDSIKSNEKEDL